MVEPDACANLTSGTSATIRVQHTPAGEDDPIVLVPAVGNAWAAPRTRNEGPTGPSFASIGGSSGTTCRCLLGRSLLLRRRLLRGSLLLRRRLLRGSLLLRRRLLRGCLLLRRRLLRGCLLLGRSLLGGHQITSSSG